MEYTLRINKVFHVFMHELYMNYFPRHRQQVYLACINIHDMFLIFNQTNSTHRGNMKNLIFCQKFLKLS